MRAPSEMGELVPIMIGKIERRVIIGLNAVLFTISFFLPHRGRGKVNQQSCHILHTKNKDKQSVREYGQTTSP